MDSSGLYRLNKQFVKDFKVGTQVSSYFKVDTVDRRSKKNGEPYLVLSIADLTGSITGVAWDNVEAIQKEIETSRIVFITGEITDYNGLQLNVRQVRICKESEYEIDNLIKTLPDREGLLDNVKKLLDSIQNKWLQRLVETFFSDHIFIERLSRAPGGWKWHHSYIGGLLKHTHEVLEICVTMCKLHPEINRDLCLMGAFIHDIGKVFELRYDEVFEYTDAGRLVGHIIQGNDFLQTKIDMIPEFPQELRVELQHILLSHQGEYEQRSPVLPQTLEACVVYHADNLDSQANAFKNVIFGLRDEGQTWSKWLSIINRQLKLQEPKEIIF